MRIGINVSWMMPGQTGGMEWYVRNLIRHLAAIDEQNEYVLVTGHMNHTTFSCPSHRFRQVVYIGMQNQPEAFQYIHGCRTRKDFRRALQQQLNNVRGVSIWDRELAELIRYEKIDIWFCPLIFAVPVDVDVPMVITIPDLQHEHFPEFFSEHDLALRAMAYADGCRRAAAVIGISTFTADEIRHYCLPVKEDKVFAVPLALDDSEQLETREIAEQALAVRKKYDLPEQFLYYPANGWPHKNHETLIRAMEKIAGKKEISLVLTGSEFDLQNRINPLIDQLNLHDAVLHLGYVPRQDIPGLFGAAAALVFPSLFEGFGLPVLEAMNLGVPVACSDIGNLPALGDDALWYFDPQCPESIAETVLQLLENPGIRTARMEKARSRAQHYSYHRNAVQTLEIFERVFRGDLANPGSPAPLPLNFEGKLKHGICRFNFHCPHLHAMHFTMQIPRKGQIQAMLDQEEVLNETVRGSHRRVFSVKFAGSQGNGSGPFHSFTLKWHGRHLFRCPESALLQLVAEDLNGRMLKLVS